MGNYSPHPRSLDSLLNTAKAIEDEHNADREAKLESDRQNKLAANRDKIDVRMDELEEVLESDAVFLRLEEDKRYVGKSNGAFKIEISDTEDFHAATLLFDSRDLSATVNKSGMELLMLTFARSYTFQGYEVYINGERYNPYLL